MNSDDVNVNELKHRNRKVIDLILAVMDFVKLRLISISLKGYQ